MKASSKPSRLYGHLAFGFILVMFPLTLWSAIVNAHPHAKYIQTQHNLKHILLGLHNYHDTYGSFPPAMVTDPSGKPLYSWRVLILPMIDEKGLYQKFDLSQPWDAPVNRKLVTEMPELYHSPISDGERSDGMTTYQALVDRKEARTALHPTRGRKLSEIRDGTSNTIALIENLSDPVIWTQPDDTDPATFLAQFPRDDDQADLFVGYCDGSAGNLRGKVLSALSAGMYAADGKRGTER